jgi:hypothetical protein
MTASDLGETDLITLDALIYSDRLFDGFSEEEPINDNWSCYVQIAWRQYCRRLLSVQ